MNFFKRTNEITLKIAKGMIAIFVAQSIILIFVFTFQACSSEDNQILESNNKFNKALQISAFNINNISLFNSEGRMSKSNEEIETLYLISDSKESLTETGLVESVDNIESLILTKDQEGLELTKTLKDGMKLIATYNIHEPTAREALEPAIVEAKNYLLSKGFTNDIIDDMLIEQQGTEEDLVALVMSMTEIESQQNNSPLVNKLNNFNFFTSAYAQKELTLSEVGSCAAVATGADVLSALGGSSASSWTIPAMKKAFGAVAKRMLGPIGVAIAVVTFGICLLNQAQD